MNLLVVGSEKQKLECQEKFKGHTISFVDEIDHAIDALTKTDVVFDFNISQNRSSLRIYQQNTRFSVFADTTLISLAEIAAHQSINFTLFGFCGLPTFINRPQLEVSILRKEHEENLKKICRDLSTEFVLVDDRIGMVTPRVISMIINEAYYTVQEGTASREDINIAMKLGTNYPYGPFEWCAKIGVKNVYEVLRAVYEDTRDERYKICPLLKKEYLSSFQII